MMEDRDSAVFRVRIAGMEFMTRTILRRFVVATALALTGLGGAFWWATLESSGAPRAPGDAPKEASGARVAATVEHDAPSDDSRTIVEFVIRDECGTPFEGVRWVAHGGRTNDEPIAIGVTRADGRSSFHASPGRLMIEVLRAPGRGPAAALVTIEEHTASPVAAELTVGCGGSITGRVVDDSGEPVIGLSVDLVPTIGEILAGADEGVSVRATRTGADGFFEIENVTSLPQTYADPLHWTTLSPVLLSFGGCAETSTTLDRGTRYFVLDDEALDVGDVVLPRPVVFAGRVVNAAGSPIAGTLVSAHPHRRRAVDSGAWHRPGTSLRTRPGAEEFTLLDDEVLTAGDGSFVLRTRESEALVWTANGVRRIVDLPSAVPGGEVNDLEWSVGRDETLEVVLLDGERVVTESARPFRWGDPKPTGTRFERGWGARFQLERRGGECRRINLVADSDGVFRVPLVFPRQHLDRMRVFLAGWLSTEVRGIDLPDAGEPLQLTLEPFPEVRLSIVIPDQDPDRVAPDYSSSVDVEVCKLDPARRAALRERLAGRRLLACCGSGSQFKGRARIDGGTTFEVDMPVQELGEYWVYVSDLPGRPAVELTLGPYAPGAARHEIPVDPLPEQAPDSSVAEDDPEPVQVPDRWVVIRGRVIDDETGRPLTDVDTRSRHHGSAWFSNGARTDSAGRFVCRIPAGSDEAFSFRHRNYASLERVLRLERPGGGVDFRDVRLKRVESVGAIEAIEGYLVRANGPDLERRGGLVALGTNGSRGRTLTNLDGSFELDAKLAPGDPLWLTMHGMDRRGYRIPGAQRLVVDQWRPDRVNEFEVAPWQDAEIRLSGFSDDTLYSGLMVRVTPTHADDIDSPPVFAHVFASEVALPLADGVRTFYLAVAPGRGGTIAGLLRRRGARGRRSSGSDRPRTVRRLMSMTWTSKSQND